ncbi:hypothetical protein GCM10019059_40850 [Camelimonas fluminis]|uniref:Uncharacterized protein n=1 Tax=Camelimonas fluminis TaxID=1576911 RepID=A0ABV7UC76_9HYPH|nr:hypothetical protein [Camelimonas fluminis]GHE77697.1 hypothetical protein GCM10019059_40850 [Camelimonas fluminis]
MRTVSETRLLQETLRSFFMRVNGWNGERYDARAYALAREVTKIFQEAEDTTTDQPPLPPDTLCDREVPRKAASYARLAGICRRINWHNVGDPAMDDDQTKDAMIELTAWLFDDCGIKNPFSIEPAPETGAENSLLRIAVARIIEPRRFLLPNQQSHEHGAFNDDPTMPSRTSVIRKADDIIALISGYTLHGAQPGIQAPVGPPARVPEASSVADPDPAPRPNWPNLAVDSAAVTIAAAGKRQPDG